jgi:hypothetical protein
VANPLSRRLLQLAGLLSLLLIAVVVNYLLHDGSEVVNPIAEAAQRTAAMPGARLKFEITYSSENTSKTITGTGDGVYDGRTGRSDVQVTMPLPDGGSMWVEALGDDRTIYTRSSTLESVLPPGKLWLGMQPLLGHDPGNALGGGPGAQGILEQLKAVGGNVEEVDHQSVGGHPTTRYKTTIDPSREAEFFAQGGDRTLAREYEAIAEQAPEPIQVEVWIDGHGLARLIDLEQKLPIAPGGPALTIGTRMEFFAFGHKSTIPLPPKSKVFDYTPVLRAELGLEDGHSLGPLDPPAGAKPLSAAAFRHKANAICGRAYTEARALLPQEQRLIERIKLMAPDAANPTAVLPLLRGLANWLEGPIYRLWHRQFRELTALVPPPGEAASYRRFQLLEVQSTEWALAEARAFQIGLTKMPNAAGQKDEHHRQEMEARKIAAELGIPTCTKKLSAENSSAELS